METRKSGTKSGRGDKKIDTVATEQVKMVSVQGVGEIHREATRQEKEIIKKGTRKREKL